MLCYYCGKELTKRNKTVDHKIPKCRGGVGGSNIVPCCKPCNGNKADMTDIEYEEYKRTGIKPFTDSERSEIHYREKLMRGRNDLYISLN